jgi:N-methylhydantoinase B/oxoprolinase/acetone carboxylase alpha subunit
MSEIENMTIDELLDEIITEYAGTRRVYEIREEILHRTKQSPIVKAMIEHEFILGTEDGSPFIYRQNGEFIVHRDGSLSYCIQNPKVKQ